MITELTQNPNLTQIRSLLSIRSETELLMCCMRYQFNRATSEQIAQLLRNDINWNILREEAVEHNVFLLLYQTLKNTHPELIPLSIFKQFEIGVQKRIGRNIFLCNKLFEVLDLLAAHNIQAIPFKGPIWAILAYGNMALRDFSDLDLLVRPKDYSKAKQLLNQQGYYETNSEIETKIAQVQMLHSQSQVKIDLHFGLVSQDFYLQLDSESFFEELQTISIWGRTLTTFSLENSLVLGYIHGTKDSWKSLKRLCDFAALIRICPDVNWSEIVARCNTNYSDRNFCFGITIVQNYLEISFPNDLVEKTKLLPKLSEIVEQHQQLFYCGELGTNYHIFGGLRLSPMIENGFWGKIGYFLEKAFTINKKDREIFTLPGFLFFLYYPLRIIRLVKSYKINLHKIAFLWNLLRL